MSFCLHSCNVATSIFGPSANLLRTVHSDYLNVSFPVAIIQREKSRVAPEKCAERPLHTYCGQSVVRCTRQHPANCGHNRFTSA